MNARQRRHRWRMRGRLLEEALQGSRTLHGGLHFRGRDSWGCVHFSLEPLRPRWARRLTASQWRAVWEWAAAEFPMARAFRAAALREAGDEAGLRRLYGAAHAIA